MYNRDKIIKELKEIAELSKNIDPYVVIAQPRRDLEETPAQALHEISHKNHINFAGFTHGFIDIGGEVVDVARNYLIERVIESGAKYMFFVGEDTVVPFNGFKILHETSLKNPDAVITGVYYFKNELNEPMIMINVDNTIAVANVDPGKVIDAWQTGMDCMLIPVSILKKMKEDEPELPFCCIANNVEGVPFVGEDNFFVHRLFKSGFKLLTDTNVQCLHVDLATGKYAAHPSVDERLGDYKTIIPITGRIGKDDIAYLEKRWNDRLPKGSYYTEDKE